MNKKLLIFLISVAVLGIIIGTITNPSTASAGLFQDLLNRFFPGLKSTPQEVIPVDQDEESIPVVPYSPTVDYEEAVISAVDTGLISVVSIIISKDLPIIEQCPYDPFANLPPDVRQFFGGGTEFYQPCQKGTEKKKVGSGSGFIVSEGGLILTNKHVVIDKEADYTVITNDGEKYDAEVLARDPVQDLAVLKINASGLTPARLGDSDSIKLGQTAVAIGFSLGEFSNSVSIGVISGLSRTITASGKGIGTETIQGVIQTDAAINPGNSGGPLLNLKGEVIGVNVAIASGAENIGFAIPINQAKRDIESVRRTGDIKVPYLGVRYITVTSEFASEENLPVDNGSLIRGNSDGPGVLPNSPASKAGLKAEDIVLEINGEKVTTEKTLGILIQKYNIGNIITLKVHRGGNIVTLQATLEERPEL